MTLQETTFCHAPMAQARLWQAQYFLDRANKYCEVGTDEHDSYFKVCCHVDAFLFAICSQEDLSGHKQELLDCSAFRFAKALRNTTVHHAPVVAQNQRKGEERAVSRIIRETSDQSMELILDSHKMRDFLDGRLTQRPKEEFTISAAHEFLDSVEESGGDYQPLLQVLHGIMVEVSEIIGHELYEGEEW